MALASSASVFAALGDERRLRLVARLSGEGPLSITRLAQEFDISRQAVTKHLRLMEHAGLVRSTQQGRQIVWELEQARLIEVRRHLEAISTEWDRTLGRLRRFVER